MGEMERIRVIDTHTEGEPTRVLIRDSLPEGCEDALTAREEFIRSETKTRTLLLQEPRGHRDQFGSVVYPSRDGETDFTVFFMTTSGYLDMCVHATIGTSTALVHDGRISAEEGERKVKFNTPAGGVTVKIRTDGERAESVSLMNVPSFSLGEKMVEVGPPVNRKVGVEVAFGGNFYAIVDEGDIGIQVDPSNLDQLRSAGKAVSKAVYDQVAPTHPANDSISSRPLTMVTGKPRISPENYRNVVVFPNGSFDRSPCGTGTSARAAALLRRDQIGIGETFTHESITGTTFQCRLAGRSEVGGHEAILPEITGSAWVTQISELIIQESDPLKNGFLIG